MSVRASDVSRPLPLSPQEQAVEREHEREEFQREIESLEERLRQAARPRPRGSCGSEVSQPQRDPSARRLGSI